MKKFFYYASALLTVFMTYSCAMYDKPVDVPESFTIVDNNGNKYETDLVATFAGEVGSEVTLTLGVYDAFDIYGVDFGDGNIIVDTVCYQNGGLLGEDGKTKEGTEHKSATKFTGIVAGNGIISVYGKSDLWYVIADGGAIPTSFDQEKLKKVVQVRITGANVEQLELPELDSLKQFNFNNSPLKSIDLSKATALTSLTINSTAASKYDPQLESIDLSKNVNLESLNIQGSTKANGKLKKLDLSNNTKLTGMGLYVQYNELEELIIGENALTTINVQNNKLAALDLTKFPKLKNLYASDNEFKELDFSQLQSGGDINIYNNQLKEINIPVSVKNLNATNNKLEKVTLTDCTASCKLENNCLTIATLPTKPASLNTASKIKKFTYNPQADMEVTLDGAVLDLSAQASAQGELEAPVATTFAIKAGNAVLEAGKDYTIDNGKITFLKSAQGAVVEMTTEAFPKLTVLRTKEFDVTVGSAETGNALFSWEAGKATGGTVAGNGADAENVKEDVITISAKKANIATDNITITLNEALKAGDVISVTGYKYKNAEGKIVSLYLWFNDDTNMFNDSETWVNIYKDDSNPDYDSDGDTPNTNTYVVPEGAAGVKVIKLARSKAQTNLFVKKFIIERK